jgi:hypothetical protein
MPYVGKLVAMQPDFNKGFLQDVFCFAGRTCIMQKDPVELRIIMLVDMSEGGLASIENLDKEIIFIG